MAEFTKIEGELEDTLGGYEAEYVGDDEAVATGEELEWLERKEAEASRPIDPALVKAMQGGLIPSDLLDEWSTKANINIRANKGTSPESERGYLKRSRETGMPLPLLRSMDNRDLDSVDPLKGITNPQTLKMLADNPSLAIVMRREFQRLDDIVKSQEFAKMPLDVRKRWVEEDIQRQGYSPAQLVQLNAAGYQQDADGKWFFMKKDELSSYADMDQRGVRRDYKAREYVERPVLPEWYMGPTERGAEMAERALREGAAKVTMDEWTRGLSGKDLARTLTKDIQVIQGLYQVYGTSWKDYDDDNLRAALNFVGGALGLPTEDIPLERVRPREFLREYTDPAEALDIYGLGSLYRDWRRGRPDEKEIARIANNLDTATENDLAWLNEELMRTHRELRGKAGTTTAIEGLMNSGKFALELGLLPGGKEMSAAALTGNIAQKGFWKAIGSFLKGVAVGEAKRLPLYVPGFAAGEFLDDTNLDFGVDAAGSMRAELTEKETGEMVTNVFNRLISQYIANTSERLGAGFDAMAAKVGVQRVLNMLPPKMSAAVLDNALTRTFGKMERSKWLQVMRRFNDEAGISGPIGEFGEEYFDKVMSGGVTALARVFDSKVGDLGNDQIFFTKEEALDVAGQVLLTSMVFRSPQIITAPSRVAAVTNFVDAQTAFKAGVAQSEELSQSPELVRDVYFQHGLPRTAHVDAGKLKEFLESGGNAKDGTIYMPITVGVTQEQLDAAEIEGAVVEVSLADAAAYLSPEAHSRLMQIASPANFNVNVTAERLKELWDKKSLDDRATEAVETRKAFDEVIQALVDMGQPRQTVRRAAEILAHGANYLAFEGAQSPADWIRNVAFEKMKEADWMEKYGQVLYQTGRVPFITGPDASELSPEMREEVERQKRAAGGDVTKTPFFKRFFGEWEAAPLPRHKTDDRGQVPSALTGATASQEGNDNISQKSEKSSDVSKVVDGDGKPLKVYHGTTARFRAFRRGDIGYHFGTQEQAENRVSEEDWNNVDGYTMTPLDNAGLLSGYLNIRNPLYLPTDFGSWEGDMVAEKLLYDYYDALPFELTEVDRQQLAEMARSTSKTVNVKMRRWLEGKGFDGIIYEKSVEGEGKSYIIFSPTQFKNSDNLGTFDPQSADMYLQTSEVKKGATTFHPEIDTASINDTWQATITLFEGAADASTLVHEIEHYLHRMMELLVESGLASERMQGDLAKLKEWASMTPEEAEKGYKKYAEELKAADPKAVPASFEVWQNIMYHEKVARGFEAFVMEGVAPKAELVGAFSHLKKLMLSIYGSVEALGAPLSDDVRMVFRGMLASESTLQHDDSLSSIVKAIETGLLGLNQDEIKAMRKLVALRNDQALAQLDAEKAKRLKELRKVWRSEAEELMKSDPLYSAWTSIEREGGLEYDVVAELVGEDFAKELRKRGLTSKKGVAGKHPATFASQHGFDSVDDLIEALLAEPSPSEFIKDYLATSEQRFHETFQMSDAAMSVQATIDLMEEMYRKLHDLRGQEGRKVRLEELRLRAEKAVGSMPVSWIMNDRSLSKTAGIQVGKLNEAMAKNDVDAAIKALNSVRHTIALTKAKADARRNIEKLARTVRRGLRAKRRTIDESYQEAIRDLVQRFGIVNVKSRDPKTTVASVLSDYNKNHPDSLFGASDLALNGRTPLGQIVYDDVIELIDLAEFLYGEGKALVSADRQRIAEQREANVSAWVEEVSQHKYDLPGGSKAVDAAVSVVTLNSKLRNIIGWACKFDENSALWQNLYKPVMRGQSYAQQLANPSLRVLDEAFDNIAQASKKWNLDLLKDIKFPADMTKLNRKYRKWDATMVLMACLNMGCEKNRQRLVDGFEWGEQGKAYCDRIAGLLSKSDWAIVQQIWDAVNRKDLVEAMQKTFRSVNHYDLKMEPASKFEVTTADGETVEIKGGYIPLMYAYHKSPDIQKMSEGGKLAPEFMSPGFSKERIEVSEDPLDLLRPHLLKCHIEDVAYYACNYQMLRELLPAVRDHRFKVAFSVKQGALRYDQMIKLFDNIAAPGQWMRGQVNGVEKLIRQLSNSLHLWLNLRVSAKQLGSFSIGMDELGKYYWDSLVSFALNPPERYREVAEMSGFMANRVGQYDFDFTLRADRDLASRASVIQKVGSKVGRGLTDITDGAVAFVAWRAAFDKATAEGMSPADAIAEADEFVAKTQGGSRPVDMSPSQLDRFWRMFQMFFTARSAQAASASEAVGKLIYGRKETVKEVALTVLSTVMAPVALTSLLSWWLSGNDDDDDFMGNYWKYLLDASFENVPAGGVLADAVGYFAGYRKANRDAFSVPILKTVNMMYLDAKKALPSKGDADFLQAAYRIANIVSLWYGVPVLTAYDRIIKNVEDWADGDVSLDLKEKAGLKKPNQRR